MPQTRKATIGLERATGKSYERADWRFCPSTIVSGNRLSRALVLEGPNEFILGEEEKFVPHGYAVLSLDGEHLMEEVRDARGTVIYSKQLA
ncbi:hypothetical protein XH99_14050 [Bradyrhizobium nanningense]|uniref:Uncharacterized protein n=1 Tax=Bradyrhizobium nanningense TaxID=1325118 RepID=A0A4Q0S671_9BRAD|nr:hypothetical protein [Bradyrhizobium nanningense]RXH28929.1 hypothetical protein XH99_14050 [Bradyrhizobium nanningense]